MMNNIANVGQSFNPDEVTWPPSNFGSQYRHAQHYMHSNNGYGFSPFPAGSSYHCNNFDMNPINNLHLPAAVTEMKDYTLIDVPSSRRIDQRELGLVGTLSARWRAAGNIYMRRGSFNIDPFKRCTNYNCNTNDTPMWRKGPLGPKTLCNACGIKYRKEEEKRKAKEANKSNADQDSNSQPA